MLAIRIKRQAQSKQAAYRQSIKGRGWLAWSILWRITILSHSDSLILLVKSSWTCASNIIWIYYNLSASRKQALSWKLWDISFQTTKGQKVRWPSIVIRIWALKLSTWQLRQATATWLRSSCWISREILTREHLVIKQWCTVQHSVTRASCLSSFSLAAII